METHNTVQKFNASFKGDPLTPRDAMALGQTVAFSDFAPTKTGRYSTTGGFSVDFPSYLKGEVTIREVPLLCDLPDWVLVQVNNHWLTRMGECIMRIGDSILERARIPVMRCIADEVAMSIVITNTDPPRQGDDEIYPGLLGGEDIFGCDPDVDDPDDMASHREEWMDRMFGGLIPTDSANGHRGTKLALMKWYGQGVYETSDPLHPLRWFDRYDLSERFNREIELLELPEEEREKQERAAMERAANAMDEAFKE
ncbi:hypothetical protein [Nocardiopsis rhodophaea]